MRPRIVDSLNGIFDTTFFSFVVPDPAFVYALAIAVCAILFVRRSREDGLSQYHALGGVIWGTLGGLAGARVFFLLTHYDRVWSNPAMMLDLNGATVSWGAYLGGALGLLLYFRLKHQPALRYLDVVATCLGLGVCLGRLSCFLNGDDFGTLSTVPWAVSFPHGSYPFAAQVKAGLIDALEPLSLTIHPVQIYGSMKGLALFFLFTSLWRRYAFPAGAIFSLYWMMFALLRFGIEFFRGDVSRGYVGLLSTGQFMSVIIFLCGTAFLGYLIATRRPQFATKPSYNRAIHEVKQ